MAGTANDGQATGASGSGGVAIVTGATGVVGRHILMHLKRLGNWKILAISRKDKVNWLYVV